MELTNLSAKTLPELNGKFLVVETLSDGYTGIVNGHYNYEVVTKGEDYEIYPTLWNNEKAQFVKANEMVVYTNGDTVFYVTRTTKDPYNHAVISELIVEEGMDKDKRTLQAFRLFADDLFSIGNYNVFLTHQIDVVDSPNNVKVESVSLDKESGTLYVGDTVELTATVLPENATVKDVTFSVVPEGIATVTATGAKATVTAKVKGSTNVIVTTLDGDKTAQYALTVKEHVLVSGITLNKEATSIVKGATETLVATVTPPDAENKAVTWASDKPAVAKVDQNGKVTAVDGGTANITATTVDGKKVATCVVTVTVPVTGVTLDTNAITLEIDGTQKLVATVAPINATNKKVTWKSDKPEIATVDQEGTVTGIADGTANVTAETEDGKKVATCAVTVNPAQA
ncbi:major tail protein [Enterococcus phage EfV12-phi1]|uniref:Major tail protein n=1 Tax=Enterococcus phage EfV12-phi1 TaxID=2315766 RepID=A0A3B8DXQ9_9CAUD|nr:structural protein with Ig domain [Enterococcus phage EfV12-phi1]AYJ73527.1 major tail protein [Enterococcus phage EfV12-phi1]